MKKVLLAALLCTITSGASAQEMMTDGLAVINAAYEKVGGDAWRDVTSMITRNDITINTAQGELSGDGTITMKFPGYVHASMILEFDDPTAPPMGQITQVVTPDTAFMQMAQGSQPLPKGTGPDYPNRELELIEMEDASYELSVEESDESSVYVVTVSDGEETIVVHYDTESLLRVKSIETNNGVELTTTYKDFKDVDGKLVAHRTTRNGGGQSQVIRTKSIEFNPDVESVFTGM